MHDRALRYVFFAERMQMDSDRVDAERLEVLDAYTDIYAARAEAHDRIRARDEAATRARNAGRGRFSRGR